MSETLAAVMSDGYWLGPGKVMPEIAYRQDQEAPGGTYYLDEISSRYNALGGRHFSPELHSSHYLDLPELPPGQGVFSILRVSQWRGNGLLLREVVAAHPLGEAGMARTPEEFEERATLAQHPSHFALGARWVDYQQGRMVEMERIYAIPSHVRRDEQGNPTGYLIGIRADQVQAMHNVPPRDRSEKPAPKRNPAIPQPTVHERNIVLAGLKFRQPYREKTDNRHLRLRRMIIAGHILLPEGMPVMPGQRRPSQP